MKPFSPEQASRRNADKKETARHKKRSMNGGLKKRQLEKKASTESQ